MRSRPPVIGIYLGTEYSCVGVCRNGRVHIIENDIGKTRTPSCVAFTPDKRLIGEAAEIQADKNPTNTIFDINRMIGKPFSDPTVQSDRKQWPFNVIEGAGDKPNIVVQYRGDKKQFLPEQLSAMILKKMKEIAENYLKCIVQDAVVTVPAYFSDSQKLATKDACEIAGLKVLNIMDEPIAAATFYRFEKFSSKENVLVFSLGGSNFDVSVLKFKKGVFEVMATAGDMHLGSMDFDNRLLDYFLLEIERRYEKDIRDNPMSISKLRCACERVKRSIYKGARTFAPVDVHGLYEGIDFNTIITQARFEEINMDLFKRCMGFVTKCLENARMDKTAIDQVMLVGDDTQIPMVQQMLRELFDGKEFCISTNPNEVVAYGAAIKANRLWMWHATPKAEARPAHQLELLEAHKLIEQLIYEGDDAKKHSEELISEIHDARRLSEAAQKRVEQLISETDDARKLSEAAQKRTEQLMFERDDVRKLLEATQKLTEQLLYERDEARKFSEAAQKLTEQLVFERDDTRKLLGKAKTQINQLISERDEAGKKIEELHWLTEQQAHHSQCVGCFIGYSYSKLQNATNNFHETYKLGEGGFGKVYKGNLHNTTIAIKIPNELSNQGAKQFHQEVEVLSKLQHPHLVKLLGACAENHALIYEYMPNGSLQDRLDCKNNTPPLSWQARARIAFEICSALSFLHSSKPHGIAHGDLKPGNVLLDLNNVSKISDFGLCRELNWTTSTSRPFHKTNTVKGTFGYIDPEFMTTLKMTPQNDVYSFGIMLLQLVTCKDPANIRESVDEAHRKGTLKALIDASAGPWPFKEAQKMISLGLRCSDPVRINRPDMSTVVLKEMKSIASAAQSSRVASIFCR